MELALFEQQDKKVTAESWEVMAKRFRCAVAVFSSSELNKLFLLASASTFC